MADDRVPPDPRAAPDGPASVIGQWRRLNSKESSPYGSTETYEIGGHWLESCATVEDWGCGRRFFARYAPGRYRGIDGGSRHADAIVDLTDYRSSVEGIFMRHVLEHNRQWDRIFANAIASFTRRFALILFTPLADVTHEIAWLANPGCPDISFALEDLTGPLEAAGVKWSSQTLTTDTYYGEETVILAERKQ